MNLLEKAKARKLKVEKLEKPKKPTFKVGDILSVDKKSGELKKETEIEIGNGVEVNILAPLPEVIEEIDKATKKLKKASTPKTENTPTKKGRIFGFIGKHGTGKSFACANFAQKWQKTLYLDAEYKASEIFDEQYPDLKYDMKEPIKHKGKKHSQIFKDDSDVHIDIIQVINETTGKRDDLASIAYIIKNTPLYIQLIKSGKYKNLIIDSCSPIWDYAKKEWLRKNKGRTRPNKFEYAEIEAIKQDILLPFVNYCKIYNVNLILVFGIADHYVNDVNIGYKEDAKQWLLNIFSYELWFEYDYSKYCLKHPYRPFWVVKDEDLNISEYLFDKEFLDEGKVDFKDFEDFKYESMTSEIYRQDSKKKKTTSLVKG